jgi:hypothetical protein
MRAIALFTGGLDSQLAVRLLHEQGLSVQGLFVETPLCTGTAERAQAAAATVEMPLVIRSLGEGYCELLRRPKFPRLEGAAPCVDCRISMFAEARRLMEQTAADFVVSGEVVGQRPRTAIRDLEVVAHHAGLESKLLRPLSAGLLPATGMEESRLVDRTRLPAIQGKSRKQQLALAKTLGLPITADRRPDCPLLSEPLASRVGDALADERPLRATDLPLLRIGRHFLTDERTRVIVARNQSESEALLAHASRANRNDCIALAPQDFAGPIALVLEASDDWSCSFAAQRMAAFGRVEDRETVTVLVHRASGKQVLHVTV